MPNHEQQRGDRAEFGPDPARVNTVLMQVRYVDRLTGGIGEAQQDFNRDLMLNNDMLRGVVGELAVRAKGDSIKSGEK